MMCKREEESWLGLSVYRLAKRIREELKRANREDGIPEELAKCGWLLSLIAGRKGDVYQKDLETMTPLAKSTITGMVQTLEGAGLLQRVSVERDARLKKMILTEKGQDFQKRSDEHFLKLERRLKGQIKQSDLDCFIRVLRQMNRNFEEES